MSCDYSPEMFFRQMSNKVSKERFALKNLLSDANLEFQNETGGSGFS